MDTDRARANELVTDQLRPRQQTVRFSSAREYEGRPLRACIRASGGHVGALAGAVGAVVAPFGRLSAAASRSVRSDRHDAFIRTGAVGGAML